MNPIEKLDEKYGDHALWQFVKFNLVSFSIFLLQVVLAYALPFIFDSIVTPLPEFLGKFFDPNVLFDGESKYVVNGVVTWGYILTFFFSTLIANIYGYFVNMKKTFNGKGKKYSMPIYLAVVFLLILFDTWAQGRLTPIFSRGLLAPFARTIAISLSGLVNMAVLFPLEKYVLFKEEE